jgi:hypothetical protein
MGHNDLAMDTIGRLGFLELQHDVPHARGGLPTPENLRVLCRAHNVLMAERDFGRAFMQERLSRVRRSAEGEVEECWSRNRCERDP